MKVTAIIEKADNDFFTIYTAGDAPGCGFGGCGESVEIAKRDYLESIGEFRELAAEQGRSFPDSVEVEFRYDIPSFFNNFDWINISAFAKKAGINESKMRAYKAGLASASQKTLLKIQNTIREICAEMAEATISPKK